VDDFSECLICEQHFVGEHLRRAGELWRGTRAPSADPMRLVRCGCHRQRCEGDGCQQNDSHAARYRIVPQYPLRKTNNRYLNRLVRRPVARISASGDHLLFEAGN
jgi:hypothetical protein